MTATRRSEARTVRYTGRKEERKSVSHDAHLTLRPPHSPCNCGFVRVRYVPCGATLGSDRQQVVDRCRGRFDRSCTVPFDVTEGPHEVPGGAQASRSCGMMIGRGVGGAQYLGGIAASSLDAAPHVHAFGGRRAGSCQLSLIIRVQVLVESEEGGTATASIVFCRQTGQSCARWSSARSPTAPSSSLPRRRARGTRRRAVVEAIRTAYLGAACLMLLVMARPWRGPRSILSAPADQCQSNEWAISVIPV